MIKSLLKIVLVTLFAAAIAGGPAQEPAKNKEKPAAEKKEPGEKKPSAHPFHGKLVAVDKAAKTITVGKSTYLITSQSKIAKSGKPAALEEGVVGEEVGGYVKPNEEGKLVATTVHFGPKPTVKANEKKK